MSITAGFGAQPLAGGFSGETFRVEGPEGPAVLRVYGREPARAAVDASLMRLVRDLVPTPRVLDLRPPDPAEPGAPAHLLVSFEPGVRLSEVLPHAGARLAEALAASLARVLVALGGMPFLRPAQFVDADLGLADRAAPADGLVDWLDLHASGPVLGGWDRGLLRSLSEVCADADALLDSVRRWCLVHSDFNPKNILVDPLSGSVTSVVDWEYAHAGSPYADLGNLLRFERGSRWSALVVERYVALAPPAPADPLRLGFASDLWALVDLAARPVRNEVTDAASALLLAVAASGDLAARPGPGYAPTQ